MLSRRVDHIDHIVKVAGIDSVGLRLRLRWRRRASRRGSAASMRIRRSRRSSPPRLQGRGRAQDPRRELPPRVPEGEDFRTSTVPHLRRRQFEDGSIIGGVPRPRGRTPLYPRRAETERQCSTPAPPRWWWLNPASTIMRHCVERRPDRRVTCLVKRRAVAGSRRLRAGEPGTCSWAPRARPACSPDAIRADQSGHPPPVASTISTTVGPSLRA